jgi:hypothetical protein
MKELKKIIDEINKNSTSADDLADYILYKSGLEPENNDFYKKIEAIEDRLRCDEEFAEEFRMMNGEMSDIDNFVIGVNPATNKEGRVKEESNSTESRSKGKGIRYAFASILAIGLVYIGLLLISDFSKPDYYQYAALDEKPEYYTTRGRESDDFQNSLKALDEGEYEEAINYLEADIINNQGDETIFYTHYVLGLSYLETASSSFLGLFPSYDIEKATKAVANFNQSIEKNTSGKFQNITLDAHYFAAKGYLMLGDRVRAKEYLEKVVNERGSKVEEAAGILKELE